MTSTNLIHICDICLHSHNRVTYILQIFSGPCLPSSYFWLQTIVHNNIIFLENKRVLHNDRIISRVERDVNINFVGYILLFLTNSSPQSSLRTSWNITQYSWFGALHLSFAFSKPVFLFSAVTSNDYSIKLPLFVQLPLNMATTLLSVTPTT